MALILLFVLGIVNFAIHRAVSDSGHPLLGQMPWTRGPLGGTFGLLTEYLMLLACMLMTDRGAGGWVWGYGLYTAANGVALWLILSRRI
jgi:hypothetical protein